MVNKYVEYEQKSLLRKKNFRVEAELLGLRRSLTFRGKVWRCEAECGGAKQSVEFRGGV